MNATQCAYRMLNTMSHNEAMQKHEDPNSFSELGWEFFLKTTNVMDSSDAKAEFVKDFKKGMKEWKAEIDVKAGKAFSETLIKSEWMVIGKLQEQKVTDLFGSELNRAFANVNERRWCHKIVRVLIRRGLTFEMLSEL